VEVLRAGEESRVFRHILVSIDLSERNERTLGTALALAREGRTRVTLLHVVQRVAGISRRELGSFYGHIVQKSRRKLSRAARRFADAGVPVRTAVVIGEPAGEIIKAAGRRKVDLVVIGSHRVVLGRPGRGLGSTSYKVGIACPCSILLVK
jgi:universal stress protein A